MSLQLKMHSQNGKISFTVPCHIPKMLGQKGKSNNKGDFVHICGLKNQQNNIIVIFGIFTKKVRKWLSILSNFAKLKKNHFWFFGFLWYTHLENNKRSICIISEIYQTYASLDKQKAISSTGIVLRKYPFCFSSNLFLKMCQYLAFIYVYNTI